MPIITQIISKALRFIKNLMKELCLSEDDQRLIQLLADQHLISGGKSVALVQAHYDFWYFSKLPFFFKALSQLNNQTFRVEWAETFIFFVRNRSFKDLIVQNFLRLPLERRKWRKYFCALGGNKIAIRPTRDLKSNAYLDEANKIFQNLREARDLERLRIRDIYVGDLVYDTYLRFYHKPTVDLKCPFLLEILEWTILLIEKFENTFKKTKYDLYVTSYASYIHHGIGVRVALKKGIPVYDLLAAGQLVVLPTIEFPYHRRNHHKYIEWLNQLPKEEFERGLDIGHTELKRRLGGNIDVATYYMKQSAYTYSADFDVTKHLPKKSKRTIVLMGHDFFDSPHIYGDMLFPDFYIWLRETLLELKKFDFEVLIKPHPNGVEGNAQIHAAIAKEFPFVTYVPSQISTLQLAERGVELFVTVYGTIAHEMAYLGHRVLSAGENPHSSFSFTYTAKTLADYFRALCQPESIAKPMKESDEIASYYFMHNYRTLKQEPQLFSHTMLIQETLNVLDPNNADFAKRLMTIKSTLKTIDQI